MISMVMDPLKTYFKEHMPVNPFTIDLEHALSKIDTRMLLIYSLNDSVVHCSHAQDIVRHCRRNPQ
jgi:esterase/lipase